MIKPDPCPCLGITSIQKFMPRVVVAILTTAGWTFSKTSMLIFSSVETMSGLDSASVSEALKSSDLAVGLEPKKRKVSSFLDHKKSKRRITPINIICFISCHK